MHLWSIYYVLCTRSQATEPRNDHNSSSIIITWNKPRNVTRWYVIKHPVMSCGQYVLLEFISNRPYRQKLSGKASWKRPIFLLTNQTLFFFFLLFLSSKQLGSRLTKLLMETFSMQAVIICHGFLELSWFQEIVFTSSVHNACYQIVFLYQNVYITDFSNFLSNYVIREISFFLRFFKPLPNPIETWILLKTYHPLSLQTSPT